MSRILPALVAFGAGFAAPEVAAATPYVQKAIGELSADLKSNDPVGALLATATNAYNAMKADPGVVPSFTGILTAAAQAAMGGFAAFNAPDPAPAAADTTKAS